MNEKALIIGWIITVAVAIIGWVIAIVLSIKNRDLQKTIEQKKMRHEAYLTFIKEMDAISKEINSMPFQSILSMTTDCATGLVAIDYNDPNHAVKEAQCIEKMYKELWQCIEDMVKPIQRISQAIAVLELDATDELRPMLFELKSVVMHIDEEWRIALETTPQDKEGIQQLAEVAKSKKWNKYQHLYDQIIQQMRKECNIY